MIGSWDNMTNMNSKLNEISRVIEIS